ncbi:related to phenylcoumaran benzylic ether reductase [Cephalotrichum gorgonifer]|uniref:Related to phenylcoumaran benzylic ether reductase n=1 Tax=Cephalotrichum gorgonifer TaxID=2041049 RepID=A0AAE8N5L8_9PEZI|nr:related to phenylcoumaran benzylic ether reductase [Cephalotrichum gorgonifer]
MASFDPPSKILIFGGTGKIGAYITEALLSASPPFPHVALFTSEETARSKAALLSGWESRGLSVIKGDVTDKAQVQAAYATGVDAVVSALGRNVLLHQTDLIRWAEEQEGGSVRWFFPSEYGTDIEYGPSSAGERPHQNKLAVRRFIKDEVRRLKNTFLVTGPYAEMYLNLIPGVPEGGGFDVKGKKAVLLEDGNGKVGVGKGVVAALRHPEAALDKVLKIQSFVVTPREILAAFEKHTGGEPWAVEYVPLDKLRAVEEQLWKDGNPIATGPTLRRIWGEGSTLYEKTDNEAIGLRGEDLESLDDVVRSAVEESRGARQ